jgi:enoyl-CoA hydratase/carnithine racemase
VDEFEPVRSIESVCHQQVRCCHRFVSSATEQTMTNTSGIVDIPLPLATGAGRAFSTGRDLKDSKTHTPQQAEEYMWKAHDSVLAVKALGRPTIAALNGHA